MIRNIYQGLFFFGISVCIINHTYGQHIFEGSTKLKNAHLTKNQTQKPAEQQQCGQDERINNLLKTFDERELKKWFEGATAFNSNRQYVYKKQSNSINIPINAVVVRKSNGKGGVTENDLVQGLAKVNQAYSTTPFQFYYSGIEYKNSDQYYTIISDNEAVQMANAYNKPNVLNAYFVSHVKGGANGTAQFPWESAPDNFFLIANHIVNHSTYPHEIGHYLQLQQCRGFTL